ncbi:MAG: 30S ribosomal protein S20 [Flavobacteriia bacterium]|nr:30S ribosomal protein S20 [Flavobacteriia bacterium]
MANHKSSIKRIRTNETRRVLNKYQHKTARNATKRLREIKDRVEAEKLFPTVAKMIDKLAKRHIIHQNKAANLKSGLQVFINTL